MSKELYLSDRKAIERKALNTQNLKTYTSTQATKDGLLKNGYFRLNDCRYIKLSDLKIATPAKKAKSKKQAPSNIEELAAAKDKLKTFSPKFAKKQNGDLKNGFHKLKNGNIILIAHLEVIEEKA